MYFYNYMNFNSLYAMGATFSFVGGEGEGKHTLVTLPRLNPDDYDYTD